MKKFTTILTAFLVLGLFIPNLNAQEKKGQLWYCWEETVKPGKIDEYLALSKEFIELCKQEKFPFEFYTWQAKPFIYELWTPIDTHNDIEKIEAEWDKITAKLGEEKYAFFNKTKLNNKKFTCTIRDDLRYSPVDPDYGRNEFAFALWIEVYIKSGKQKEFEEAVKWLNEQRTKKDYGSYVFYASAGFGYEDPCYIVMIANTNEQEFDKADKQINEVMKDEIAQYYERIFPLMRKPSINYDWHYLSNLSYTPGRNDNPARD